MSSACHHSSSKKSHIRQRRRKLTRNYAIKSCPKGKVPTLIHRFREFISKLQQQTDCNLTLIELESICPEIASKFMSSSSTTKTNISCPLICSFCELLIYEPLTLYCGHTFCETCVVKEDFPSSTSCPRCSKDMQEQIPSSIAYAREQRYGKNHFLQQILERSKTFQHQYENSSFYHQAETEYAKDNYPKAIDIYSTILEQYDDVHAFYGRGRIYMALKQPDKALADLERVVTLKPQWNRGYFYRSEILFGMKRYTAALISSLKGLALDPEDRIGKQIMARHLHAVLYDNVDEESPATEFKHLLSSNTDDQETIMSASSDNQLLMCKSAQSVSCLCVLFDGKHLHARDFDCSICTNLLWQPITTPCGHIFCRECLIRSIDNTQVQCPMCKSPLEEFFAMLIQSHVNPTEIISQMIETYFPKEFDERRHLYEQENIHGASIPQSVANNMEFITFEIPIFVCVLALPHANCPLHVFEPRYRLMMRRTSETESRTFGMCKHDKNTNTFADYGTLLFIRGIIYTQDGRSIVDTIGQRRFRVIERGMKDGYNTARVQLIRDHPVDHEEEFNDLYQSNRNTYHRVRTWFDQLDVDRQTLISRHLEDYPACDELTEGSADGPVWAWVMFNILPIESDLQYMVLISQSFRMRLQIINDTIDFLLKHQHQEHEEPLPSTDE